MIGTRDRKLSSTCHNVQSSLSIPFKPKGVVVKYKHLSQSTGFCRLRATDPTRIHHQSELKLYMIHAIMILLQLVSIAIDIFHDGAKSSFMEIQLLWLNFSLT